MSRSTSRTSRDLRLNLAALGAAGLLLAGSAGVAAASTTVPSLTPARTVVTSGRQLRSAPVYRLGCVRIPFVSCAM